MAKRFSKGKQDFEVCFWKDIQKGDILFIEDGATIPCDIVILSGESEGGSVFVETKSIDGETSLK